MLTHLLARVCVSAPTMTEWGEDKTVLYAHSGVVLSSKEEWNDVLSRKRTELKIIV